MAKPSRVAIPINFGRQDKVAPRHAPFGVLASVKNMRHRELGGLGMRNAYQLAGNTTVTGSIVAYDLHEYQGRLLALAADDGEGYPHSLFDFVGLANQAWRTGRARMVTPFTHAREVAGIEQPEGGLSNGGQDAVSGGGYVLRIYRPANVSKTYALIVDAVTNATVHFESLTDGVFAGATTKELAAFAGGKFFVQAHKTSDNSIVLVQFTVGTSSAFTAFCTVDALSATPATAVELVPVTNGSTALLVSAFDRNTAGSTQIKVWQSNGTQLGSTITIADGLQIVDIALDADQVDNTILCLTQESPTTNPAKLRTFNFAGSVLAGPTNFSTNSGPQRVCRRHPSAGSDIAYIALRTDGGFNGDSLTIQTCLVDTHGSVATFQFLDNTTISGRMYSHPGTLAPSIVFAAEIGNQTGVGGVASHSNALIHCDGSAVHCMVRDPLASTNGGTQPKGLTYDSTLGALCWGALSLQQGVVGNVTQMAVTLVDYRSRARMQSASYGGLKYFAGGTPWIYDGRAAVEAGFLLPPTISPTVTKATGGGLTPSATYTWVAHYEVTFADGSFIESAPSLPFTDLMGVSDTKATLSVTGPHSLHTVLGQSALGACVTLVISRTQWSPATTDLTTGLLGAPLSVFRRSVQTDLVSDITLFLYAKTVTIDDTTSDATLATRGAIYTQAERGEFSGSLEHDYPESCSYITASEARLWTGGLLRPFEVQVSKEAFLGQPFAWSLLSNFYGQVSKAVVGVFSLDQIRLICTTDDLYAIGSNAPDDEGKGTLDLPVRIPTPSGLKDWRSFLEEPNGVWLQLDDDKLFRMPRGGGAPTWEGKDISLLLRSYPTITAAAKHRADNVALFACNNVGLTDSRLAVRDLLFETWMVDNPPLQSSHGIEAMVGFGRTLGYVSGGIVYVQSSTSFADLGTDFIDVQLVTQPIYPFGLGGYGLIYELLLTAEYRGDCQVTISVSYNDGLTFTQSVTFVITGLSTGATVRKKWTLPINQTDSVVIKVDINTNGAATEGLIINEITLYGEDQGGSPELPPGDEA